MSIKKVTLGVKAKDKVTGFTGIVTGHGRYLTGCDQYLLNPTLGKDGAYREGQWFDENRLDVMSKGVVVEIKQGDKPGGPQHSPPRK